MPVPPYQLIASVVEETSVPLNPDAAAATLFYARGPYHLSESAARKDAYALQNGHLAMDAAIMYNELKRLGYSQDLNGFTDMVRDAGGLDEGDEEI